MKLHYLILFSIVFLTTACNVTNRLPAGEKLYSGAEIKVVDKELSSKQKKAIKADLKTFIRPKTNTSILGVRYKLWIYQHFGNPKKEKGIGNWVKNKFGEPPVLASDVSIQRNTKLLNNRMQNKGYFQSVTMGDTVPKGKMVKAEYTVKPSVQYTIRKVILPADTSSVLEKTIARNAKRSLLKVNDPYDLDVIIAERDRIDNSLKRRGFYFFNPNYLLMRVDSTIGNNKVDIFTTVKNETPSDAKRRFYINNIFVYPNYSLEPDSTKIDSTREKYKDFYVIDPEHRFKPQIFEHTMLFHKGEIYNRADHNLTLNRLVNIGTFKFVKNRFELVPDADTGRLNAYYYLTPQKFKSLRAELTGKTNNAGYSGTELQLSWRHRNVFRGAELLTLKAYAGLDFQVQGANKGYNIFNVGGEATLVWPRIVPVNFRSGSAFVPRTQLTLGYDWQNREKLYTLNTFRTSFGYLWKENERKQHEVNIINVTYVNSTNVTQQYLDSIRNDSSLARIIEKQFIFGPTYSFTFTNTTRQRNQIGIFYNGKLDLSGNLIGLIQGASPENSKTLLNVRYSQYLKTEQDFRAYFKLGGDRANQWANRIYAGIGIPYGNSTELPFIKQFFAGGTNSLRGFRARTVGPGTYRPQVDSKGFFPDQTGDIKLEFNSELRFKIVSVIHGAVFADFGNIWLKNESSYKPGAKFSSNFIKELAADAGVGIRVDLNILVIRLDLGVPIRKPWLPEKERWVLNQIDFGSSTWRRDNLVFNLAIGLPF